MRSADQIELVDMSPEALRRRMAHGNIYPPERVDTALSNYFRDGNLGALRELALLWVADRVDETLERYRETHGITGTWETRERVVVAITGAPGGEAVIRRAARMAARTKSELVGVHVRVERRPRRLGSTERSRLAAPPARRARRRSTTSSRAATSPARSCASLAARTPPRSSSARRSRSRLIGARCAVR